MSPRLFGERAIKAHLLRVWDLVAKLMDEHLLCSPTIVSLIMTNTYKGGRAHYLCSIFLVASSSGTNKNVVEACSEREKK